MDKIDISEKFNQYVDGEWQGVEDPADNIRNLDTTKLIELQDRVIDSMNEPHNPQMVSILTIVHAELLSRGEIGFRT